jgi:purine nucleosidase
MRAFIIDTDTASDDAVALIMALRWPDVQVKAITLVAGNVPVAQGTRNALYTVELCGADVPVYTGADRPLVRMMETATWFHGQDGLGDMGYPPPRRAAEPTHAVDAMIDTIRANPGVTLVTLGPLTNVALAVSRAPDIVPLVGRCVVMGGAACTAGNVTPAAEYNVWVDPEAARIVFLSGLPIEMVGWELCMREANILPPEIEMVRGFGTPLAQFAMDCNRVALEASHKQSGDPGLGLADPVAMSVALDPTICTRSSLHRVDVETQSELTRGMTVVDRYGVSVDERNRAVWRPLSEREPNVRVCWEIDIPRWKEALYSVLR